MEHKATLITDSQNPAAVAAALSVDNRNLSGQKVTTVARATTVESRVECESIRSLLTSLDDLIHSQIIAESVV